MAQLLILVAPFLDIAEDMVLRHIPMTMSDSETRLNRFIETADREVLKAWEKLQQKLLKFI
jgi:hypothetical protein